MNNEAFRALVNNQRNNNASEKSTKEIAREAVENEFKNKRRRGGGGAAGGRKRGGRSGGSGSRGFNDEDDGGSDSGSSSNEDDGDTTLKKQQQQQHDDNEPEWKRRRREKRIQENSGGNSTSVEYRDRAKERRMNNNLDYATLDGITATAPTLEGGEMMENDRRKQAELLSKYLGGDIEHTHLVKGLDKALAEKVRREEMRIVAAGTQHHQSKMEANDDDLERVLEHAQQQFEEGSNRDWNSLQPRTELGKSIMCHLLQKQKQKQTPSPSSSSVLSSPAPSSHNIPAIQKSIQLSVLTFSLQSNVRQRGKAWEVPRMSVKAFGADTSKTSSSLATNSRRRMTPLNHQMIAAISKKLDGKKNDGVSSSSHCHTTKAQGTSLLQHASLNDNRTNEIEEHEIAKPVVEDAITMNDNADSTKRTENNHDSDDDDDDDDDDIFANVGNYIPPQAVSTTTTTSNTSPISNAAKGEIHNFTREDSTTNKEETKKLSIFDNLIPETNAKTSSSSRQSTNHRVHIMQTQTVVGKNRNVINRDIFGGGGSKDDPSSANIQKRRGPQSATMDGVSMVDYQGGYGEDIDVDFGGNDEDEDGGGEKKSSDKWQRTGKSGDNAKRGSSGDECSG